MSGADANTSFSNKSQSLTLKMFTKEQCRYYSRSKRSRTTQLEVKLQCSLGDFFAWRVLFILKLRGTLFSHRRNDVTCWEKNNDDYLSKYNS